MKALKLVAITVLLIILLLFLKLLLAFIHPASSAFTGNLIVCLQLFLAGGILFWLMMKVISRVFKKKEMPLLRTTLIYIAILLLLEAGSTYILRNADIVSKNTKRYFIEYYMGYERQIPERTSECGRYDSSLIYTYRPIAMQLQKSFEFSDSICINKAGLRDDNNSLQGPDIICLGDSYTMGWGVQQQETFPQLIERATGLKVLNAGISSYGTARETMLLKRLDTSNLRTLIIQYSFNDIAENNAFIKNSYNLPVPPPQQYDSLVTYHRWNTIYFPFKRSLLLTRIVVKDIWRQLRNPEYVQAQWALYYDTSYVSAAARSFVDILYRSGINFKKIKVLVVDMNRYPEFDHRFLETANAIVENASYNEDFKQNVLFVTTSSLNDKNCFYPLDNHLTPYGHAVLAREIIRQQTSIMNLAVRKTKHIHQHP